MIRSLCAISIVVLCSGPASAQEQAQLKPITIADLKERPVIGALGIPLGAVADVDAVMVRNERRRKGFESSYLLKITHVNGKELSAPPLIEFSVLVGSVKLAD